MRWRQRALSAISIASITIVTSLVASSLGVCQAQQMTFADLVAQPVFVFREARFLMQRSLRPPSDNQGWVSVSLPDDWSKSRPGVKGVGWYRIVVTLDKIVESNYALYLPRTAARITSAYVNGAAVGSSRGIPPQRFSQTAQLFVFSIPRIMLNPGANVIDVRVVADATYHEGISQISFGIARPINLALTTRVEWQRYAGRSAGFLAILAGCMALIAWNGRRIDSALGCLGLAAIGAGLQPAMYPLFFLGIDPLQDHPIREASMLLHDYAFAAAIASLFVTGAARERTFLVLILWGILVGAVVASLTLGLGTQPRLSPYLGLFYALTILIVAMTWYRSTPHDQEPARALLFSGALVVSAAMLHDLAIWFGYIAFDSYKLRPLVPATLAVLIGAVLLERYRRAYRTLSDANHELAQQVAARTAQLEQNYHRLGELVRGRAVVDERKRIVAEIHDGLGGTLVRLLSIVKNNNVDRARIETELNQALVELQLSFDAMEDFDLDLLVLLGSVRHRLGPTLQLAGIGVDWPVEPVPRTTWLTPERSHQLQRMLHEIFTNAIRHAKAGKIVTSVRRIAQRRVELRIEDDGCGFDHRHITAGRGLASIRRRCEAIDATLTLQTSPGKGTHFVITLPAALLDGAVDEVESRQLALTPERAWSHRFDLAREFAPSE